ncbi:hypothetical protein BCV69DRAFT_310807 [Microstroma glucosiphilum]|uniref:Uncharacterized protein n=1 Tax=Pseudomicrostroma glucosiphilum TaxID=1684307 RepID=A0A316UG44_9BASI|nr:hypothetical protein BCV69DRAFT_310807 [Pseudomicrostroma glucosiphilum]PWN23341.1 hypothetical protein BCV69DRAFT_310807 [Pseudomicrostroma glucosiphilum]
MARIISDDSRPTGRPGRRSSAKDKKPPPLISYLIFLLPALAFAIGFYAHYTSVHASPYDRLASLQKLSPPELRVKAGLPAEFGQWLDSYPFAKLPWLLDVIFGDLMSHNMGKGLFTLVLSAATTPFAALIFDALRPGTPLMLGIGYLLLVCLIGQIVMIGFAIPAFFLPVWTWYTWRQATHSPKVMRPLPSPPMPQIKTASVALGLSILTAVWTLLVPPSSSKHFFWASSAFQLYPLVWLPLLFIKPVEPTKAPKSPRLAAANVLMLMAYVNIPIYWLGLYLCVPDLLTIMRTGSGWPDDITRLIFYDTVALTLAWYIMVLIQAEVDVRALQCGGPRVHRARLFIEDTVFGSVGAVLGGPGFGMGMYFARREIMAEKARWGVQPDFATAGKEVKGAEGKK